MPQPKYPTLHADLLELRENLQRLRPDDHPVLQYNTEGLNATEHAFGLSIEVVNSSTELPNTQHRHTLYAYPHDDDTDKFTCSILLEDGAEPVIKHFDRAQLFKKPRDPRLTLGRIRNKLTAIVDAFEEFDIVQQWPETAPYSGNIVQCIWNISDKLLYFANHGIEASNFLAAVDQIKPLLKQLDYIKQGSWSPSIVDANLYEVGIHFYKFIEKQGQAESEIRQLLNFSSIVRGLINRYPGGAVVNDIIPRLFDRLPTNLRQNLNTYYTNHSSENLQEPPPLTPTPAALLNKLRQLATLYSSSDLTTKHRQKMLRLLSPDRVDQINQYAPPHMTLICETATNIVPYLNDFENYAQSCLHMWERGHQYDPYYAPETDTAAKDDYCKALILQEAQETASMLIDSLAGSNHEALEQQLDKDLQKLLNSSFMLAAIATPAALLVTGLGAVILSATIPMIAWGLLSITSISAIALLGYYLINENDYKNDSDMERQMNDVRLASTRDTVIQAQNLYLPQDNIADAASENSSALSMQTLISIFSTARGPIQENVVEPIARTVYLL